VNQAACHARDPGDTPPYTEVSSEDGSGPVAFPLSWRHSTIHGGLFRIRRSTLHQEFRFGRTPYCVVPNKTQGCRGKLPRLPSAESPYKDLYRVLGEIISKQLTLSSVDGTAEIRNPWTPREDASCFFFSCVCRVRLDVS